MHRVTRERSSPRKTREYAEALKDQAGRLRWCLAGLGYGAALKFGGDVDIPRIVGALWDAGGVVGAIGHGAHGLLRVKTSDGNLLIAGRDVTGFSKAED